MRGFGQSSTPQNVEAYGSKNITSDLAALLGTPLISVTAWLLTDPLIGFTSLDALDIQKAVFIGHDWGGAMVWRMCLFYPQRVLAACSVCTPYKAPMPMYIPLEAVVARVPEFTYHLTLADAETAGKTFDVAPRRFFTAMYRKPSEHIVREDPMALRTIFARVATDADDVMFSQRSVLLSQDELDYYVEQYSSSKFQSTCQFYATRKMDFESEVDLPAVIPHPVLFIAAAKDEVLKPEMARGMPQFIPNLETKLVEDAGHWVLWEQKEQVNALLAEWLVKVATSHDKV
jgi:soluble epoxide hydrolase/lipid-phosphate phosphatase